MKVLIFDTETTGLPTDYNASINDVHKWPHVVQLSYIYYDTETKALLKVGDHLIKVGPDVLITPQSIAIHHITPEICQEKGEPLLAVLEAFNALVKNADLVVGHNLSFDKRVLQVECRRLLISHSFAPNPTASHQTPREFCTMQAGTAICAIPKVNPRTSQTYYKYPSLVELHRHLFGGGLPRGTHNALGDVLLTLRCYGQMQHGHDIAVDAGVDAQLQELLISTCL